MPRTVPAMLLGMSIAAAGGPAFASQQPEQDAKPEAGTTTPSSPSLPSGLGQALRNLEKFIEDRTFNNPAGRGPGGAVVRFDSQGADFDPWMQRFGAQLHRNWIVPRAALTQSGRSVITFSISRQGQISDVKLSVSSGVRDFDRAAYNAVIAANPLEPLPPRYPHQKAPITVAFYYNEQPPARDDRR